MISNASPHPPAEFNSLEKTDDISDYELFSSDNQVFYTYLKKTPVTLTDDKCFRFIHLVGAHSPWHQDAQMNEIENGTYEQSIEASMTIVATYLQKLKDSGVYDNTAIMILSDHGYNIEDDDSSEKRQHPILFVKGVGEHYDELQISSAPISQSDYLEAYTRLLDGKQGDPSLITRKEMPENDVFCSMITMSPLIFMSICRPDMPEM